MLAPMTPVSWVLALACVVAIAAGQVLFKRVGLEVESAGTWIDARVIAYAAASFVLYGAATLLWIHVLRTAPLSRVYPLMALSFVLVPLASWYLYGDGLTPWHGLGIALIVLGVLAIGWAG